MVSTRSERGIRRAKLKMQLGGRAACLICRRLWLNPYYQSHEDYGSTQEEELTEFDDLVNDREKLKQTNSPDTNGPIGYPITSTPSS